MITHHLPPIRRAVARFATRSLRLSLSPSFFLLALACRDSVSADRPAPPAPFEITPPTSQTLEIPRTLVLSTRGGSDSGAVAWQSSDEVVASVSASGVVTARFPGSVTITARRGPATATTSVESVAGRLDVEPNLVTVDPNGSQQLTATVRDADGVALIGVPVHWRTANAAVASVDATTGLVVGIAAGTTSITADGGGATGIAGVVVNQVSGPPLVLSSIGSTGNHACALESPTGLVHCWGDNHAGALGIGYRAESDFPIRVNGAHRFSSLSVGYYATCGVEAETGLVYCWGGNEFGDLGDGSTTTRWEPSLVTSGDIRFTSVSASGGLTCGVATTGLAYCWGKGGLIGDGTLAQRSIPTVVANGTMRFSSISASTSHACGIEAQTGIAYCWGRNDSGLIGDATTTDRLVPTLVAGDRRFSSISAGAVSCGIERDSGFAYCWGPNASGQVGDGTRTDRLVPTLVGGGNTRFSSISATGSASVCGIEGQTGLAYCWGSYVGRPGDGVTTDRLEPTLVGGGETRFSSIGAAYTGFCGVEAQTGLGYCWSYSQPVATPIPRPMASAFAPSIRAGTRP